MCCVIAWNQVCECDFESVKRCVLKRFQSHECSGNNDGTWNFVWNNCLSRVCVWRVSFLYKKWEIMLLHNKANHSPLLSFFFLLHNWLMPVRQLLWEDVETWERLFHFFFFFFNPRARFNLHSLLPACLHSFHSAVFSARPPCAKWPCIGSDTHSGALFSRWLTLKN